MAKKMSFCLKWGSSCGIPFDKNKFCDEHMEWNYLREYLDDRPLQPWTDFTITDVTSGGNKTKKRLYIKKSKSVKKTVKTSV